MKRTALALLVLGAAAAPASAGGGGCHTGGGVDEKAATTVKIDHACFLPGAAFVAPGATVTFLNDSGLDHNIGGPGIEFQELANGGKVAITFATSGLYPYACTLHPGMAGVVVVGPLPTAPAAEPAAMAPAATTTTADGGGSSAAPLVAGVAAAVVVGGAAVTFGRRARGVPQPAR
jgi:plastocyanin